MGRGTPPGDDHRPGFRLDDVAVRRHRRLRRRTRARAVRAEHARRGRPGPGGADRGGRRRGLDAAVRRAPGRARRARCRVRPAGGDPRGPGRPGAGDGPRPRRDRRDQPRRGAGGGGQRPDRRRPAASCGPPWTGSPPDCPRRWWTTRSGSGWTAASPCGAAAPWSPAPSAPAGCGWATNWSWPAPTNRSGSVACTPWARPDRRSTAVARVAVNLRGTPRDRLGRGDALLTPGRFHHTDLVDVRLAGDPAADLPATLTLHVGSAAVPVRVRPLGPDTVRLRLARPLPLLVGDRALLRDPGRHHVSGGVRVLDVAPPPLARRGAAAARAAGPRRAGRSTRPGGGAAPAPADPGRRVDPDGGRCRRAEPRSPAGGR